MSEWTKLTEASRDEKKVDIKRILTLGADINEQIGQFNSAHQCRPVQPQGGGEGTPLTWNR
eukprot:4971683-Ditylum_brightwellii.AAC.1